MLFGALEGPWLISKLGVLLSREPPAGIKTTGFSLEFLYPSLCCGSRLARYICMCAWVMAACQFNLFKLIREGSTRWARLGGPKESPRARVPHSLTLSLSLIPYRQQRRLKKWGFFFPLSLRLFCLIFAETGSERASSSPIVSSIWKGWYFVLNFLLFYFWLWTKSQTFTYLCS